MSKRTTKPRAILVTLYFVILMTIYFAVSHFSGFGSFG